MKNPYDSLVNFCSIELIDVRKEQVLRSIINKIIQYERLKEIELELKQDNPIDIHNQLVKKQREILQSLTTLTI